MATTRYDSIEFPARMKITDLSRAFECESECFGFCLASINAEFIVLTGGGNYHGSRRSEAYVLDIRKGAWHESPMGIRLNKGRFFHASTAIDRTLYVYGGRWDVNGHLRDIEWLKFDSQGSPEHDPGQ